MLTTQDIEALNTARQILRKINLDARTQAWGKPAGQVDGHDLGRLSEASDIAEGAIFNVLNTAHSYCQVEIPDVLMHMRDEV